MSQSSRRVLLVDDDRTLSEVLEEQLEESGFQVACAHDGRTALRLLRSVKPHVVLLDLVLPDLDGTELLERMDERPELARVPILVLSGLLTKGYGGTPRSRRVTYLAKPASIDEVVRAIEDLVEGTNGVGAGC